MSTDLNNKSLQITSKDFGTLKCGQNVKLFTLENTHGVQVKITNYGGIIVALETPDKDGGLSDIVLGYDDIVGYENDPYYLGAIIGRFAGRIDQGVLVIDDKTYQLQINHHDNQLHGGLKALNKQLWQATMVSSEKSVSLILEHKSPDGDNGFPGNVNFKVKYSLSNQNELLLEYFASTDKTTIVNLTQHSYFNLAGHDTGNVFQQKIQINAGHFLPMDERIYPTGDICPVINTAHDFRQSTPIGKNILSNDEQVVIAKGFDNYWLTSPAAISGETFTAQAIEPNSGRRLTLYSDQPCLVLYTGNYLDGSQVGKSNYHYQQYGAFCLEPQQFANSNSSADISNTLLRPEKPFYSQSRYVFDVIDT